MWVKALGEHFFLRGTSTLFPPSAFHFADEKNQISHLDRDRIFTRCLSHLATVWHLLIFVFLYFPPREDFLLEEISRNHEVSRIKSIGGAAQVKFASVSSPRAPRSSPRSLIT